MLLLIKLEISKTCVLKTDLEWCKLQSTQKRKAYDIKSYQFYELKGIIVIIVFHISNISHYLMILSRCYYKSSVICLDYLFLLFFVST